MTAVPDMIERYLYDVTRRLPKKEREEVARELRANIHDMLGDRTGEEDIKAVLRELGPPAALAEKYRQTQRYLIAPVFYDEYIRTLKWVVPLVGVVMMAVGAALSAFLTASGERDVPEIVGAIISETLSMGFSGATQALLWVTVGFIIADRAGYKLGEKDWRPEDLPPVPANDKSRILRSSSIAELILVTAFSALGIFMCYGNIPFIFTASGGGMQPVRVFNDGFLGICIPLIIVLTAFTIAECAVKIKAARWTPAVCASVLINNAASVGIMFFLITRTDVFDAEFLEFIMYESWSGLGLDELIGRSVKDPLLVIIASVVIISALAECVTAVCRTLKTAGERR